MTTSEAAPTVTRRPDGYQISTDPDRLDVDRVHRWLSTDAYWALGRDRETVARAIAGSLNFGLYAPDGQQVGFARVVTDLATFAWLCDVYVRPEDRGRGLGTWLATTVRDHLAPHRLKRILLFTEDAHEVYARVGFTALPEPPERVMSLRLDDD
ncbi:GNAT family N-acetyltransferase [Streptomyces triticirhizae]|uniref:N-acetyltransferase n=1 Tax=Streptomyces triticirhizae TaxID=2483353 RepID=A0A3M2KVB1_9ACTN|nr:GNAT family N-acetyltransferase [Streptomyces triticirhizae]RMI29572.1 N-acetyltransferase [Streptomyces triticirhizae]